MTIFTLLWIGWLLYFLIVEAIAVIKGTPGLTLSAHFWMIFGIKASKEDGTHIVWRRMAAVAGWSVLSVHLLTGWI